MTTVQYQNEALKDFHGGIKTVATTPADMVLGLLTDPGPIPPSATLEQVTEATYEGYARSPVVTWGTAHLSDEGAVVQWTKGEEFKPTGSNGSSLVTHVAAIQGTPPTLIGVYKLSTPLNFSTPDDVHTVAFPLIMSQPVAIDEQPWP